jgi:hypothetical protein
MKGSKIEIAKVLDCSRWAELELGQHFSLAPFDVSRRRRTDPPHILGLPGGRSSDVEKEADSSAPSSTAYPSHVDKYRGHFFCEHKKPDFAMLPRHIQEILEKPASRRLFRGSS